MIANKHHIFFAETLLKEPYGNRVAPLFDKLVDIMVELHTFKEETMLREIPPRLKDQLWFLADTGEYRGHIVKKGADSGFLKIPENIETSTIGIYFVV
jgi:hypothetical protein